MLDALKSLFETNAISEEIKNDIEEAWNAKVKENQMQITAELREEFASKYEHDKANMVEAVEKMLDEKLNEEISEFAEDRKKLAEARAKYHVAMRENADLLKGFVMEQLGKEVSELHEDQKAMASKFGKLEEFVVDALAKEIAEFHEDKKDLAETKVRLIREAKEHLSKVKQSFIEKGAKVVEKTVAKTLNNEISQLKEDIDTARKNDFGRKIFETFAEEYNNSYMNEKSETAKLLKVVELKDKQLAEAKANAEEKAKLVESKDAEIMQDLLESVETEKLQGHFNKYLSAVIDGKSVAKKATLTEAKEITGDKEENSSSASDSAKVDNVVDIRRLAGLN